MAEGEVVRVSYQCELSFSADGSLGSNRWYEWSTMYYTRLIFLLEVARTCNIIFIVLDVLKPLGDKKIIEGELEGFGIRLNKKPPAVIVRKKDKGGVAITNTVPLTNIDHDEIKAVLSEYKLSNADVTIREPNCTSDDLVDVIEGNR